ncbi:hypothetical protein KIN20_004961 [Parelaphostrongylus tenuis]|uniref:Uncharacterized protein n=1 Tax=Parelaphostrongylus tenuis TaxID=148309 RepID=A0AAD5MKM8_PARTN|nr:hypothetical protein KIN20_004961 [Parelaphostrongylus tenuis]
MLGIMNSPADSVEFYAVNRKLHDGTMSEEDLKAFTEVKDKQNISYTKDGRRIVDGKIVDGECGTASSLWKSVLHRGAVRTHMKIDKEQAEESEDGCREVNEQDDSKAPKNPEIEVVEEPLLAAAPTDTPESCAVSDAL